MEVSHAVQDYLKALHHLGGAERLVTPNDLAERLEVRGPSVTGMLKRLAEAGWIHYESGRGASLTPTGLREALRVVRRHRLVELFLHRVLKLDWSEVDAEAEALEHAISPRLERALAEFLGEPLEDPHGHPIPSPEGVIAQRNAEPLVGLKIGDVFVVREVPDDNPERLRRWHELGLTPGARGRLVSHQPLDDVFELDMGSNVVRLGQEGLAGVLGERLSEE
ncbi:MAG TPA: metal-dependent transcriptional regulator [Gemmatales bacterium]|nr:metal-dependent transcriptional regulator [Gemmatales bacterium]HMP61220.1 metal-dependent transcriptional regulator [Gemmatales bacterium]